MSIYEYWISGSPSSSGGNKDNTGNFQTADSGINPKKVGLYNPSLKEMKKLQTIPNNFSKEKIIALNDHANRLAASNVKLAKGTQVQVRAIRALAQGVTIQMNGQKAIADVVGNLETATAQYGMGVEAFDLQHEMTVQGYSSYVNEFQKGSSAIAGTLEGW